MANAERFRDRASGRFLFVDGLSWLYWDGRRWIEAREGQDVRECADTMKGIYSEAYNAPNQDERKRLAKHAERSESARKIRDALWIAQSMLPAKVETFDAQKCPTS